MSTWSSVTGSSPPLEPADTPDPRSEPSHTDSRSAETDAALWGEAASDQARPRTDRPGRASLGPAGPPSAERRPDPLPRSPGSPNLALQKLRDDLDDDGAVDRIVGDFLAILDQRVRGLEQLLRTGEPDDAVTALLTLETSGLMVGATELARTAVRLRGAVVEGRTGAFDSLFERLVVAAARTKIVLARS